MWFEALEEIGEKPIMSYCIHSSSDQKIEWIELPHKSYDGFGGLFYLAETVDPGVIVDYKLTERKLSIWLKIKSIFIYAHEGNIRKTNWINFSPLKDGENTRKIIELNSYTINKIKAQAKKEKVSLQIYLLKHFDRFISEVFLEPSQERWWMLPINMRKIEDKHSRGNHSSYISLQISDSTSSRQIQEIFISKLKNGAQWVPWFFMHVFSFIGIESIKKILLNYENNNHSWAGIFTYLDFTINNDINGYFKDKKIIGVAPVTKAHSIACDVIKTETEISICLHFHKGHDLILIEKFLTKFNHFLD